MTEGIQTELKYRGDPAENYATVCPSFRGAARQPHSSHGTGIFLACLRDDSMIPWPLKSPDLSSIEKVLTGQQIQLVANGADLVSQLCQLWQNLLQENIRRLYASMPDRITACQGWSNTVPLASASFYGASYISYPLQDAKSTTDLALKFRTRRADAMLFLAAGRTDYCLVRLETGRVKVHINVGAGEREVVSPKGLRLDDLTWHEIVITRSDAAFTLKVDSIHVVKEKLPGRFFELNIHYGLFLGGQGDFSELFLGHLDNLRGCLADVRYNGVNVLARARERIGQVDVQGITWTCAPEFDAGMDKDISFVEDGAFMALPNVISRTGVRWHLDMKTSSQRGVLLYNTGLTSQSDFVGVELLNGRIRLLMNKGNGPTELQNEQTVSDGKWHSVVVQFNPTFMEISVDGTAVSLRLPQGGNRYLDLAETVYVGGIELNKRSRALNQGILTANTGFKGCLRNMDVENQRLGIPNARITQGILPDCVWEYPCSQQPCVTGAQCLQQGVDSFRCECDQPLCVKPDYSSTYKVFSKPTLPLDLEILVLTPLHVAEGDNTLITTKNIDIVLDYPKFGVRDSGVLLHVVEPPRNGRLAVEVWERGGSNPRLAFTMLDLAKDKVRYLHDGSENLQDSIMFELELSAGTGFILPSYLQGRHRFVLPVNITPVNDPPSLTLPAGKVLRLAQGTKKILTPDVLHAEDPDSPNADLVYTVLSQGGDEKGFIERIQNPGKPVDSFTQLEIDQGLVAYVHRGEANGNSRIALQVSDGIETSSAGFLRVSAFPLQLRLVNNTGLIITHKAAARITASNLTFTTNAEDPNLDIRYEVVKPTQFGHLQRLRGAGSEAQWQTIDHFMSHQLNRDQIRYIHTSGNPSHDEFKFKVSVMEVQNPTVYDFRITFTELRLALVHNYELQLNGTREALLTEKYLEYRTKPLPSDSSRIVYHLLRPPRYGALHTSSAKHRRLQNGDSFTQQDLEMGRLRYRLHRKAYSHVRDDFTFHVSAPDCETESGTFTLLHVPSGKTKEEVRATLERLQVSEGGRQAVLRTHLDLETDGITELMYNVTHGPHHGRLDVMDVGLVTVLRKNTLYFSSRELLTERVFYIHDDSETRRDSFHFVALSSEEEDFQYVGVFHVDVLLKNDNTPVRAVDKVFHIVTGGEKLLTGRDLRYSDADIDTQPSDIVYTRRGIPNGGIYQATDPSVPLFEFSQDDLDNNRVLFRHEGEEYGKVGLWITDGQFYANGILEVRASPPFVEVANNTGLIVQHGGSASLTLANLSADTNLNLWGEQIVYEVLEGPSHGHLQLEHHPKSLNRFTEVDLQQGHLFYYHDGGAFYNDHFRFRIDAGGTTIDGKFSIRVFPASYWEPLIVANNHSLHVEESTSVVITSSALKVMHPQIPATDITYIVVEPPLYGYLEVEPVLDIVEDQGDLEEPRPSSVNVFEQSLVNEGRLHYIQATANQTRDQFVIDVTNGISWLRGLQVNIVIIPEWLYIGGGEIRVVEGDTVTLSPSLLPVLTEYYKGRVTEYRVLNFPQAGVLQYSREPGQQLQKFTAAQLKAGLLQYQHDGSETLRDQFVVMGLAGEKKSAPATLKVLVTPVNDEPPFLVNNTGMRMWEGSISTITSSQLAAVDKDTAPENLTFSVFSPRRGYVAFVSAPSIPIQKFTQSQINNNMITFVHKGGKGAGFDLTVSDGVKTAGQLSFTVSACKVRLKHASDNHLHVFPMRRQAITPAQLLTKASDHTRTILYTVTSPPSLGRLMMESIPTGSPQEAVNFTQRDINESRIFYEHTHPFFGLSTNDSLVYDVRADFTEPILDQYLHIDISVSSGGLDQFLVLTPLEVEEGGSVVVRFNTSGVVDFLETHADVDIPGVMVQLSASLMHGELCVAGEGNATSFTPAQMDAGEVVYQHDHSDTLYDELQFSLLLEPGDVVLCNASLPITVHPINDQPFHLITQAPHISVVQGQAKNITQDDLLTEDPDTPPEEIMYILINGPTQGRLTFRNNSMNDSVMIVKFTQADINAGHVIYEHSGRLLPVTFYFRVSDGRFNPEYTVFNVHVLPVSLNVTVGTPVLLQQGSSVAMITSDQLITASNARLDNVHYNITRPPQHGMIYVHDVATKEFGQLDLDSKRVMYMQTDMTTASDSFEVSAWLPEGTAVVNGLEVKVNVEPLLRIGNFSPIAGTKTRISLDVLDATPLAKLTNSNPSFQVLRHPRLGRMKKIIRSSGEKRNMKEREVKHFSHEEIKSGVIYYVVRQLPKQESDGAEDSFQFLLAASIFQPALGELRFRVRPEYESDMSVAPTMTAPLPPRAAGPRDPEGHEGGLSVASPNMSSDYVLIVSMVLGVVVLAVLVIVVVKCRSVHVGREESRTCKSDLSGVPPVPLPRPPDDLPPTSPRPKRFASNGSPTPVNNPLPTPAAMLQCKVIPLEPVDSVASSEPDLNSRYPYGVADEPAEDWSSYDTSELAYPPRTTNPMLRRNQYWV
ncbi:chondroitin sulfate proteoglycan 4 [Anabrus simplex]|uniref:chondroitin sulfate proteoglycan 4 n=1 Tax=Anabrus simplex TaxID=316456 RepID=UPI0035A37707